MPRISALLAVLTFAGSPLYAQDTLRWEEPLPPAQCVADDGRIEVLLVGSYHMSNPGMDQFNLEADDVLLPKRQAEIAALVERLAAFRPTKVLVEAPWADSATHARYDQYFEGTRELRKSEEEQIGFRLAKRMGHERIYPVDVRMRLDNEAMGPLIGANPAFQERLGRLNHLGQEAMRIMGAWLAEGTVGDMLFNMNRPEMLVRAHEPYVEYFVPIVVDTNYAGADMVATWYRRNLRIFANLHRVADSPDDRLFVIYGQGHVKILRDLVEDAPGLCVEDALEYLR